MPPLHPLGRADRSGAKAGDQGQSPTGEGYLGCAQNSDPRRDTPGGWGESDKVCAGRWGLKLARPYGCVRV